MTVAMVTAITICTDNKLQQGMTLKMQQSPGHDGDGK